MRLERQFLLRFGTAMTAAWLLAGCASVPVVGGLFDGEEAAEIAEEGSDEAEGRKAVLALREDLLPDPRFIGTSITLPPEFANGEWTQPGGEADHAMHHLSAPQELRRAWSAKVGLGADTDSPITAPPVVAEGKIFALDPAANVVAFDVQSGKKLWDARLTPEMERGGEKKFWSMPFASGPAPETVGFGGGLAYDGGWLYMTSGFGRIASLNASTGEVRWEVDLGMPVRNPPTAAFGKLFFVTTTNQIVALDQASGEQLWTHESFEETARFLSAASPAVQAGVVVAPFSNGEVVALDWDTGRSLWSTTVARSSRLTALSDLNDIAGSPVVDRGGVFAVSHSGPLAAIDGRTGQVAWEKGMSSLQTPWVADETLFLVTVEGEVVAVSRDDGAVIWSQQLDNYENMKSKKKPISWSGPVLAGEQLLLTSSAGRLVQLDPQNGQTNEAYKLSSGATIPPIVADGTVFVLTDKGRIEAWR